jgi:SAM-dependent methyltransferase
MHLKTTEEATVDLYRDAALEADRALCCVSTPAWRVPGLVVPQIMHDMNYGCGSTVRPIDVAPDSTVLYIGVGAGLELLQFAYLTRRLGSVVGIDIVDEMIDRCRSNLAIAAEENDWFESNFVDLRRGDAIDLPLEDQSVDVVAQNCLFNIFESERLDSALSEAHRVLKKGGTLVLSDPICEGDIPSRVRSNAELRAACLSGAISLDAYLERLVRAGFGTIEVRSRRPYRALTPEDHGVDEVTMLETIEVAAIRTEVPADGPCIFSGHTATYVGRQENFDDGNGHVLRPNIPLEVCDKTAAALAVANRDDIVLSPSTWHYGGGGCC